MSDIKHSGTKNYVIIPVIFGGLAFLLRLLGYYIAINWAGGFAKFVDGLYISVQVIKFSDGVGHDSVFITLAQLCSLIVVLWVAWFVVGKPRFRNIFNKPTGHTVIVGAAPLQRAERIKWIFAKCLRFLLLIGAVIIIVNFYRTKTEYYAETEYYADYVDKWGLAEGVIKLQPEQIAKRQAHYRFERSQNKLRRVIHANSAGTAVDHTNTEHDDRAAIQEFIYDENGRLLEIERKNANGKTVVTYALSGKNFDGVDLQNKEHGDAASFTAMSGNLLAIAESGAKAEIKRFKLTRNQDGYITRKEFKRYNREDGVAASAADGVSGFEYELDAFGRPQVVRYLGSDYAPMPNKNGVMERRYEYDQYGNIRWEGFYGKDGTPILNEQRYSFYAIITDDNGNIIEGSYSDVDGKPCLNNDYWAKWTAKYDERGNRTAMEFFDAEGKPCPHKYGYAKVKEEYDPRGNLTAEAYFDIYDKPCLTNGGVAAGAAKWTAEYNERGNLIVMEFFDAEGKPYLTDADVAKIKMEYDERNNLIVAKYFGTNGKDPCLNNKGFAKLKMEYDRRDNLIGEEYFGTDGKKLCLNNEGFAKIKMEYDSRDNLIGVEYFGTNGKDLCLNNEGFAKIKMEYDKQGNLIGVEYFDTDGKLRLNKAGVAKVMLEYDKQGNLIELTFRGVDEKLSRHKSGMAKMKREYDANSKPRNVILYDENDTIIREVDFDEFGKMLDVK